MPLCFEVLRALRNLGDLSSLKHHASEDTKSRASGAYLALHSSQEEVSRFYFVSQSTISRWVKQCLDPTYKNTKNETKARIVQEQPLIFLRELQTIASQLFNKDVSVSSLHRVLTSSGFTHKVATTVVRKARRNLITAFESRVNRTLGTILQNQLVFIDELSIRKEHYVRQYGWSPSGTAVHAVSHWHNVKQVSLIVAMTVNGYLSSHLKQGHFNRHGFIDFLQMLISSGLLSQFPGPRSVVILDGCTIHRSPEIYEAVRKCGLKYLILAPYTPESNPIESFFAIFRKRLREESTRFPAATNNQLINSALERLRNRNCSALFDRAGWRQHSQYRSPYMTNEKLRQQIDDD
ncbi:hypothetical protein RCL1_008215 [Eukaryota sp. TZLM3-RCL]